MTWDAAKVSAYLCELKVQGLSWENAWRRAEHRWPSLVNPSSASALFDADTGDPVEVEETVEESMRRFCEQAWHGEKPKLREFTLDLLRDSDPARDAPRRVMVGV